MIRALNTAATGMQSQETMVNTISNNIANANTNGFKSSRTEFEDLLYETQKESGDKTSTGSEHTVGQQIGSGAAVSGIKKEMDQGSPLITSNPYDLMIQGEGFFGIIGPNEEVLYTRDGSLSVNAQSELTTKKGFKIYPGITLPADTTHLNIADDGSVEAFVKGQKDPVVAGKIPLYTFSNPVGLKSLGGNLYSMTSGSGSATEQVAGRGIAGAIQQGALEGSNVNIMSEMTNLIKAQRTYEMNSKVMGIADQMLQTINNIK
jgi:flagellar basal-body rod protein FlgG